MDSYANHYCCQMCRQPLSPQEVLYQRVTVGTYTFYLCYTCIYRLIFHRFQEQHVRCWTCTFYNFPICMCNYGIPRENYFHRYRRPDWEAFSTTGEGKYVRICYHAHAWCQSYIRYRYGSRWKSMEPNGTLWKVLEGSSRYSFILEVTISFQNVL